MVVTLCHYQKQLENQRIEEMNMPPFGKALTELAKTFFAGVSHANLLWEVFGALTGKDLPNDAFTLAKGLSGIFGLKDERMITTLILALEKEWLRNGKKFGGKRVENPREILAGYFAWQFPKQTPEQRLLAWWYGNQFRNFLTAMGSSPGKKEGETTSTWQTTEAGVTTRHSRKMEHVGEGINNPLDYLRMMVMVICAEPTQAQEPHYLPGYRKLIAQSRAFGNPNVPEGAEETLKGFLENFPRLRDKLMDKSALSAEWVRSLASDEFRELKELLTEIKTGLTETLKAKIPEVERRLTELNVRTIEALKNGVELMQRRNEKLEAKRSWTHCFMKKIGC